MENLNSKKTQIVCQLFDKCEQNERERLPGEWQNVT